MIQRTLTLKMTTAQVVETSVTVNNNSPFQDYVHPDDQTQPFEMTPGFKPFTKWEMLVANNARWKWAAVKKSERKKRVTKKFLEVSSRSRAKQRQRSVQKKCAARAKLLFC